MNRARPVNDKASAPGMGAPIIPPACFVGTENPRHLRVIQALRVRPLPREQLDRVAGCSNGPELVAELRRRGLNLPCARTKKMDRDLFDCFPGVYHLDESDRRKVNLWLADRAACTRPRKAGGGDA